MWANNSDDIQYFIFIFSNQPRETKVFIYKYRLYLVYLYLFYDWRELNTRKEQVQQSSELYFYQLLRNFPNILFSAPIS
jgi:hypothetical protein